MKSVWFVLPGRSTPDDVAASLAARVGRVEAEADRWEEAMAQHEAAHMELDRRVEKLQTELDATREEWLRAYTRWWQAREGRNRALHVARRLRRRLHRAQRRCDGWGEWREAM